MQINNILLLVLLLSSNIFGQSEVTPKPGAVPVGKDSHGNAIYKLNDLESKFNDGFASPLVYRGTKSIEGEFPEVGFLGFCTATAVGPNIIYTAAHCVSNGQRVNWKMRKNNVSYAGTCGKHPQYNDRTVFNDYAFCILDQNLPEDTVFASFNISGNPKIGDETLLNGFGAPNLGTHYWGKSAITEIQGQDLVTCGAVVLGSGDSGGSFMAWTIDRNDPTKHIIHGTNSRAGGNCSYFNSTSHPNFKPYAESVAQKAKTYICGVTKDCSLGGGNDFCLEEKRTVSFLQTLLDQAKVRLGMCQKVVN